MARRRGRAPSQRQLRVGELLRHELADVLLEGHIHDPDLAGRTITITEVKVAPDMKNATAFAMPLGGADVGKTLAALRRAAPYLRRQLARRLNLKSTPQLYFELDETFDRVDRIDALLRDAGTHSIGADKSAAG